MELQAIQNKIYEVRNQKVMLDADLSNLYGIQTKVLKQAVRRNLSRFPEDFMFEMTYDEYHRLRSQIVTLDEKGRGRFTKYLPFAFTEQGIAMLSSVLKSDQAVDMNIAIMRTFVFMRQYAMNHQDLTEKLNQMEHKYNKQFRDIHEAIDYLLQKDKEKTDQGARKHIGFKGG